MWTCKQCAGENPDKFAFCPICGCPRPAPARPVVGRHMRPEDRVDAERNVDESFWAGLEEALKEEEEDTAEEVAEETPAGLPVQEEPEEPEKPEEEPEERDRRSPLLLALLIFAFLLIVFSTVTALILIDQSRNSGQEDVVYENPVPTVNAGQSVSTPNANGETEGLVVAGIMEETPAATPNIAASPYPATSPFPVVATPIPAGPVQATPVPPAVYTPSSTPEPAPTPAIYTGNIPAGNTPTGNTPTGNSSHYILADSSSRYLTEADLGRLSWEECTLARNEIYARHGYTFGIKALSDYFNSQSWYVPGGFNENDLNKFERENAAFILKYEKEHFGGSRY